MAVLKRCVRRIYGDALTGLTWGEVKNGALEMLWTGLFRKLGNLVGFSALFGLFCWLFMALSGESVVGEGLWHHVLRWVVKYGLPFGCALVGVLIVVMVRAWNKVIDDRLKGDPHAEVRCANCRMRTAWKGCYRQKSTPGTRDEYGSAYYPRMYCPHCGWELMKVVTPTSSVWVWSDDDVAALNPDTAMPPHPLTMAGLEGGLRAMEGEKALELTKVRKERKAQDARRKAEGAERPVLKADGEKALVAWAEMRLEKEAFEVAQAAFREVLDKEPEHFSALRGYAYATLRLRDKTKSDEERRRLVREVKDLLKKAIKKQPKDGLSHSYMAVALLAERDIPGYFREHKEALKQRTLPSFWKAMALMAAAEFHLCHEKGRGAHARVKDARGALEKAVRHLPTFDVAYVHLAAVYQGLGLQSKADKAIAKAERLQKQPLDHSELISRIIALAEKAKGKG